jgi:hypothetical protein
MSFFAILIILLIGLVAFFHYIQGFFSAALSAIFAVIAAAVAIGYHETIVNMLKPGKFADNATAVILCSLFAVTYVVLRLIFDRAVPGNVRLQSTIDKVGAGVMGLIAGAFTGGVFAVAAQTMPFGPTIFGYSRYATESRKDISFLIDPNGRAQTRDITDEMKSEKYEEKDKTPLLLPVDDWVLGAVSGLSDGSLAGDRPMSRIHADYLQEAYGPRVALEVGARRTASNFEGSSQINAEKVWLADSLKQVEDSELPEIRGKGSKRKEVTEEATLAKGERKPDPGTSPKLVIIRVRVNVDATDGEKSKIFRFSTGSVRLVVHEKNPATGEYNGKAKNYYAIGTMDTWGGGTFWPNHISDALFEDATAKEGVDLVFSVDDKDELTDPATGGAPSSRGGAAAAKAAAGGPQLIRKDVFLEVKRLARMDLSNKAIEPGPWTPDPKYIPLRKQRLKAPEAAPQG